MRLEALSSTPGAMPNGLQWTDEGLFVIDQLTDDVHVLDEAGRVLREMTTLTENGSGITVGGGYLWTGSNGATRARPYRETDTHEPWILKLDIDTGELVERYPTPDGGGVHGIEWDDGLLWVTSFTPKALTLVDPADFSVVRKLPMDLAVLHGLARDGEGIWCADRGDKLIVKYHAETGEEMERITFPEVSPDPHGLSIRRGVLWYSDANFPDPTRGIPEIGKIVR